MKKAGTKADAAPAFDLSAPLEVIICNRNVMLRFIAFLDKTFCLDNLTFWLETQNFKYIKDPRHTATQARTIYEKYFGPDGTDINVEEESLRLELAQKIKKPQRTVFLMVQNAIWGLIQLDCLPRFRAECPAPDKKIPPKELKQIETKCANTIRLLDLFYENDQQQPIPGSFRPNLLPGDYYNQHLHQHLPEISELWRDFDLFMAFREYLYQQSAPENLAFYLEATEFENTPTDLIPKRAKEIYDKYLNASKCSSYEINLDRMTVLNVQQKLENPTTMSLTSVKERIYKVLVHEWFPSFLLSPLYQQCNTETIEYKMTGTRLRSNTVILYEQIFKPKPKEPIVSTRKRAPTPDVTAQPVQPPGLQPNKGKDEKSNSKSKDSKEEKPTKKANKKDKADKKPKDKADKKGKD